MYKYFLFLLFLTYSCVSLFAQKNEYFFRFEKPSASFKNKLNISVHKITTDSVYAFANAKQFEEFKNSGISFTLLPHPFSGKTVKMAQNIKQATNWGTYPTYPQYVQIMNQFETDFPSLCKLYDVGESVNGRKILYLKISDNAILDENEPGVLMSSTIHGNELGGYIITLRLIDYLLNNYSTDSKIKWLVDNTEIWINPLANPDGTYAGGDSTISNATRYNANGIDLNRNFPDPEDGIHPDNEEWQPENIAYMNFISSHPVVLSAMYHSGSEVVNYPWDTWQKFHADNDWFQLISRRYADTVQNNSVSGYFNDLSNGITNGYAWYTISGGRQDYANYFKSSRDVTIEVCSSMYADSALLYNLWNYNYKAMLNYMMEANYGISGIVTDSISGEPLKAKIEIVGHDFDNSEVYSVETSGMYFRPVNPGAYDITATADGYKPKTCYNITAVDLNKTILNIALINQNQQIIDTNPKPFNISILNNPVKDDANFLITFPADGEIIYNLAQINGKNIVKEKSIRLTKGAFIYTVKMHEYPAGVYIFDFNYNNLYFAIKIFKI